MSLEHCNFGASDDFSLALLNYCSSPPTHQLTCRSKACPISFSGMLRELHTKGTEGHHELSQWRCLLLLASHCQETELYLQWHLLFAILA